MEEHSKHQMSPPRRRDQRVLSGALTGQSAPTMQQTGDADELRRWQSSEVSQPGTVAQCRWGNDTSEHKTVALGEEEEEEESRWKYWWRFDDDDDVDMIMHIVRWNIWQVTNLCPIHTADADATKQFRRVGGVLGISLLPQVTETENQRKQQTAKTKIKKLV